MSDDVNRIGKAGQMLHRTRGWIDCKTWQDAKEPESFEEVKKRNYAGRTFEVNQFNMRQLQLDIEWLIKWCEKREERR